MCNSVLKTFLRKIRRWTASLMLLIFLCLTGGAIDVLAVETDSREHFLKAKFIYNFTRFIEWPKTEFLSIKKSGLNLCLIGKDPFGVILEHTAEHLSNMGKQFNIKRSISLADTPECSILFISKSEALRLNQIISRVKGKPILLIGDTPGYADGGVGINFFSDGKQIRFEINKKVIERSGLRISSELLDLAKIIDDKID